MIESRGTTPAVGIRWESGDERQESLKAEPMQHYAILRFSFY